jgi:hypothetical protein
MITNSEMEYALEDDVKFEAFVHGLDRTKATHEDLMEFINVVASHWHDICLDKPEDDPMLEFSDDVLYAVTKQRDLAEELDDDTPIDKHYLLRILESLEMKFEKMQSDALGW